jgi:hypothetical protein
VYVSDWATLLPGFAAVFSSVGGIGVSVYAITRGSKRERKRAARGAIDRVLGTDDEDEDADRHEAITGLLEELLRQRKGDDYP